MTPDTPPLPGHLGQAPVRRTFSLLDIDLTGRVLARTHGAPTQLWELTAGGGRALTSLPTSCTGRFVPGHRAVVIEHDWGRGTTHQISLLNLVHTIIPSGLDGLHLLAHGAGVSHRLLDTHYRGVLYSASAPRANRIDLWFRDWFEGARCIRRDVPADLEGRVGNDGVTVATFSPARSEVGMTHLVSGSSRVVALPEGATPTGVYPDASTGAVLVSATHGGAHLTYAIDGQRAELAGVQAEGYVIPGGICPASAHMVTRAYAPPENLTLSGIDGEVILTWALPDPQCEVRAVWSPSGEHCAIEAGSVGWRVRLADGASEPLYSRSSSSASLR
ncbi:MAG: hypothetical protein Q4P36_00605 [Bowdeniella nasicola]|nr:hypothetical protein [Bowdeniella nasicola]